MRVRLKTPSKRIDIRPLSAGIKAKIDGEEVVFVLKKPGQYTFEPYGLHHALHIFFNPYREWNIDPNAENVRYFGPGGHEAGEIRVNDGEVVYLDDGAVVYGSVVGETCETYSFAATACSTTAEKSASSSLRSKTAFAV